MLLKFFEFKEVNYNLFIRLNVISNLNKIECI